MIRMRMDLFAESLQMGTSAVVLMPQAAAGIGMTGTDAPGAGAGVTSGPGGRDGDGGASDGVPVLYLLHGLSGDCTSWERRTSIERYADEKGIAVVMPEVRRSFYTDEAVGEKYWTWVADELPQLIARTFRVSTAREDTFVAGLSMGGFGAFKLALNRPGQFAAAASLSGVMDLVGLDLSEHAGSMARRIWDGRDIAGTADDLLGLLRAAEPGQIPPLFLDCGTEDSLVDGNRKFIALAGERGHDLTSRLRPGAHTWEFWDEGIRDVLDWLPIRGRS
ncbi:esterase family protein [Brachybacterium muris]|uniref:alpha/beta hydrolase n=1 Tax=Brachybacterium muris TaxID=219301 RepID=UPI00223BE6F7|nr:alpha/beta hydrolase family protein [Brachybacterium muris]MCT2178759.1 esterase family protein [Brachybacterium muris]